MRWPALPLAALLLAAAGPANGQSLADASEHVVTAGDTLSGIAVRAGVPMVMIAEANGLSEPYTIRLGQKLAIPRQRTHEVKAGETGFGIAYHYGVPFSQIALANGIAQDSILRIGQRLIIPALIAPREVAAPAAAPAAPPRDPAFQRPHDGSVMLGWRRRPDGGGHEGLDFSVKAGDAVRASAAGTVIFADNEPDRFGWLVVIDHGNGWHTAYGHLSRLTVKKGDTVRAGERVGLAGQTGVATEPELHFEIRKDGLPIDPSPRLGIGGHQ